MRTRFSRRTLPDTRMTAPPFRPGDHSRAATAAPSSHPPVGVPAMCASCRDRAACTSYRDRFNVFTQAADVMGIWVSVTPAMPRTTTWSPLLRRIHGAPTPPPSTSPRALAVLSSWPSPRRRISQMRSARVQSPPKVDIASSSGALLLAVIAREVVSSPRRPHLPGSPPPRIPRRLPTAKRTSAPAGE